MLQNYRITGVTVIITHNVLILTSQQNIIRDSKDIKGEMAHQLYVYQSLIFSLLADYVNARGTDNQQVSDGHTSDPYNEALLKAW